MLFHSALVNISAYCHLFLIVPVLLTFNWCTVPFQDQLLADNSGVSICSLSVLRLKEDQINSVSVSVLWPTGCSNTSALLLSITYYNQSVFSRGGRKNRSIDESRFWIDSENFKRSVRNRSPTVYDVIVKNNSKDEEKSLTVLEWETFI